MLITPVHLAISYHLTGIEAGKVVHLPVNGFDCSLCGPGIACLGCGISTQHENLPIILTEGELESKEQSNAR